MENGGNYVIYIGITKSGKLVISDRIDFYTPHNKRGMYCITIAITLLLLLVGKRSAQSTHVIKAAEVTKPRAPQLAKFIQKPCDEKREATNRKQNISFRQLYFYTTCTTTHAGYLQTTCNGKLNYAQRQRLIFQHQVRHLS